VAWAIRKRRYIEKPHVRYGKIADEICLQGRFGQKTNAGWYRYDIGSRNAIADPEVEKIITAYRKVNGIKVRQFTSEDIVKRCIFALINEGARILEEGIALRASDIDLVYLTGYGFPQFRGGPMKYADELGLHYVINELNTFYESSGDPFWKPAKLLEDYAQAGKNLNESI
jgi:3-hydroxyacyl-CoA dehydrogenase